MRVIIELLILVLSVYAIPGGRPIKSMPLNYLDYSTYPKKIVRLSWYKEYNGDSSLVENIIISNKSLSWVHIDNYLDNVETSYQYAYDTLTEKIAHINIKVKYEGKSWLDNFRRDFLFYGDTTDKIDNYSYYAGYPLEPKAKTVSNTIDTLPGVVRKRSYSLLSEPYSHWYLSKTEFQHFTDNRIDSTITENSSGKLINTYYTYTENGDTSKIITRVKRDSIDQFHDTLLTQFTYDSENRLIAWNHSKLDTSTNILTTDSASGITYKNDTTIIVNSIIKNSVLTPYRKETHSGSVNDSIIIIYEDIDTATGNWQYHWKDILLYVDSPSAISKNIKMHQNFSFIVKGNRITLPIKDLSNRISIYSITGREIQTISPELTPLGVSYLMPSLSKGVYLIQDKIGHTIKLIR